MEQLDSEFRPTHVSQEDNLADLISRIRPEHQELYQSLKNISTEAGFFNRRFVVVKTNGKTAAGPRPPTILGAVRCTALTCTHTEGSVLTLMDEASSHTLLVGHVPVKLFRFPIFVSVPIYQGVKWEAKEMEDGRYTRSLVFGVCFKQKSNVKFYNKDEVAVLTPNTYREHFGEDLPRF